MNQLHPVQAKHSMYKGVGQLSLTMDTSEDKPYTDPNIRIWAAVMLQALTDLGVLLRSHKSWSHPSVTNSEVYHWIFLDADFYDVGSFNWICEMLRIDADVARARARLKWRDIPKEITK